MPKFLLVFLFLLYAGETFAQQKQRNVPDYNAIEKAVSSKSSEFYYKPLLARYMANDTTLRDIDYTYLYYGYFFNETGDRFEEAMKIKDELTELYKSRVYNDENLKKVIDLSKKYLEIHPFDLDKMDAIYGAASRLEDTVTRAIYFHKIKRLMQTILATGDGKTCETGYHVLEVRHEYFIINAYEYQSKGQSLVGLCDYLELEPNDDKVQGMYFDVSQIFKGYSKMFEGVEKKKKKKRR